MLVSKENPDSGKIGLLKKLQRIGENRDGIIYPTASSEKKLLQENVTSS